MFLHQLERESAYMGYNRRKARKALRDERYRWTNKNVPYEIEQGLHTRTLKWIADAIKQWHMYTCILFSPRQSQSNYIIFTNVSACQSFEGMYFHPESQTIDVNGCTDLASVIHEMGHTIGFVHEQSRPDRDRYVNISVSVAGDSNYHNLGTNYVDTFDLPYDYDSVMHYDWGITTLDKDYQNRIGQRNGLSFLDIKLANLMYKCDEGCKPRPPCPDEGFVDKDCHCLCRGDSWEHPLLLCDLLFVLQVMYTDLFVICKIVKFPFKIIKISR